jgi:hypothetical protein
MPDSRLREILCDEAGRVRCPTCGDMRRVEVMLAKQRDPLIACMRLVCAHAWHAIFDTSAAVAIPAAPCDCPPSSWPPDGASDGAASRPIRR